MCEAISPQPLINVQGRVTITSVPEHSRPRHAFWPLLLARWLTSWIMTTRVLDDPRVIRGITTASGWKSKDTFLMRTTLAGLPMWQPLFQVVRLTMAFMFAIPLLSGCRSEFFPSESRAASGVVADLRSAGKVLAATTTEWYWDGHTDITDVLVVDVGASSSRGAFDKALSLLRKRGWEVSDPSVLGRTQMKSDKWEGAWVAVAPLAGYEVEAPDGSNEQLDTLNEALFNRLQEQNRSGRLVVLEAHPDPDS